jgi:DNA-binding NtrC family response regulator
MDIRNEFTLIGSSPVFRQLLNTAQLVAATRATVLITGESGSGKENLARFLHEHSPLASRPFIAVNCANLPENLVESELFGHRRGAFSNAVADRDGLVRAAHNGTLFLDEISELPLTAQAKLLRFLENGEILPLGCDRPIKVNVRVLAATNCDLEEMVQAGKFRADLFYRLQVVPMEVPPLRERVSDIPLLVEHFVELAAQRHGLSPISFGPDAMRALKSHAWPGNVRELKNLCERLTILCNFQREPLSVENLPFNIRNRQPAGGVSTVSRGAPYDLERTERDLILKALEQAKGNRTRAAKLLGISRYTLLYRMKKYFAAGDPALGIAE